VRERERETRGRSEEKTRKKEEREERERERRHTGKKKKKKKKKGEREEGGRGGGGGGSGENAFAYEIKWRIYTVRSQYTYVRSTVNYTVNRRVLFDRRVKEDRARCLDEDEKDESRGATGERGRVEKGREGRDATTGKFMEREMIYGAIVENESHGSKDV